MVDDRWDPIDHPRGDAGKFTKVEHTEADFVLYPMIPPLDWLTKNTSLCDADEPIPGSLRHILVSNVRTTGVTAAELAEVFDGDERELAYYVASRLRWLHPHIVRLKELGVSFSVTLGLSKTGTLPSEAIEAAEAGVDMSRYLDVRSWGLEQEEAIEISRVDGIDHLEYGVMRWKKASRPEAIEALQTPDVDAFAYGEFRDAGVNHEDAMFAASRPDIDIERYMVARFNGRSHELAIRRACPKPDWSPPGG